jgi:hypothetical protein
LRSGETRNAKKSFFVVTRKTIASTETKGQFVAGYGDADPSNVSFLVHGAEMRVAETRAVNRALRKAYGIGICSVEEIGPFAEATAILPRAEEASTATCQRKWPRWPEGSRPPLPIIRQHQLDPNLVKAYATDFCGVKTLREATREQVETSSRTWPTGPRKTATPCSASSTATSARKKVPHETPDHRPARRRSLCRRPDSRRSLPGSRATRQVSAAGTEALLHARSEHS